MRITEEMAREDDRLWHARDTMIELAYCSSNMPDGKVVTDQDLRFCAFLFRRAHKALADTAPVRAHRIKSGYTSPELIGFDYECGNCARYIQKHWKACPMCGHAISWPAEGEAGTSEQE